MPWNEVRFLEWAVAVLQGAWDTLFLAAPFVLLGLAAAGLLHGLVSPQTVRRWLGGRGMGGVTKAAVFGVPLPICSCGVVPLAMELDRKGASRPATLSFLITTPESSADAVLLTWVMLGPILAVVRPVATFVSALVGGAWALLRPEALGPSSVEDPAKTAVEPTACCDAGCQAGGSPDAAAVLGTGETPKTWSGRVREMGRYAFVDLLDDIAFWLVLGCLLTGLIIAFVPDDLGTTVLGSGLAPMLLLLLAGLPLYMCASSSTPIGAALVAKGVSPGAVLVFLLSGPATNGATLVLLLRHFGRRFVTVYLGSIALVAILAGLLLDLALAWGGWRVSARLAAEAGGWLGALHWSAALVFLALLIWRLVKGAGRRGLGELAAQARSLQEMAGPRARIRGPG